MGLFTAPINKLARKLKEANELEAFIKLASQKQEIQKIENTIAKVTNGKKLAIFTDAEEQEIEAAIKKLDDEIIPTYVNTTKNDGTTPLHQAAQEGRGDIIGTLFWRGAKLDALNNNGKTPLDVAKKGSAAKEELKKAISFTSGVRGTKVGVATFLGGAIALGGAAYYFSEHTDFLKNIDIFGGTPFDLSTKDALLLAGFLAVTLALIVGSSAGVYKNYKLHNPTGHVGNPKASKKDITKLLEQDM